MVTVHSSKFFLGSLIIGALLFSFFLMFHTFSFDTKTQEMRIASKAWSDFGAHIPLIRSFSYGSNWTHALSGLPIESPLYPGEPIRYHFGFYALVGLLEKAGIPIDWAINIPSAVGLTLLLWMIFATCYGLFGSLKTALLSVILFLFNGSLAFRTFFQTHPISPQSIVDITTNERFPAFGPWDGGAISAFWNLNIYTNQRHLGLSYALVLCILYLYLSPSTGHKKHINTIITALLLSLLFAFHFPSAAIALLCLSFLFIFHKTHRITIVLGILYSLPALFIIQAITNMGQHIVFEPGYLLKAPLTTTTFLSYWWKNLGLHSILIPTGLLLAKKSTRRVFLPILAVLFIAPNLFKFSPDMINNHKFFNFFLILGSMFSAFAIARIYRRISQAVPPVKIAGTVGVILITVFSTLSGVIDLFPVFNDYKGGIRDAQNSKDIRFFLTQTNPSDIVANSTWFYHPASIAGRSIYSGYTYFTWSYGYDQVTREQNLIDLYRAQSPNEACRLANRYNVAYIELSPLSEAYLQPNLTLWNTLAAAYENTQTGMKVFSTEMICK